MQNQITNRGYAPQGPLAEFVNCFWLTEGYSQPHQKERLLPDGSMALVVNLRENTTRLYEGEDHDHCREWRCAGVVSGAHSEYFVLDTAEQEHVIGVFFKAGGAFPFFEMPAGEVSNAHVPLEDFWGRRAGELRERLLEAATADAKFQILEQFLLAQAARPLERHPAVAYALGEFHGSPAGRTIADVAGQISLSARRFIEVFRDEVGLTPKLFCRVRRFQQVLRRVAQGRPVGWAGVAADCGYFDQAHFIRDFRAFSGLNPSAYLSVRNEHLNHVPILD